MSKKVLLDASAYIAYLGKEPGFEVVQGVIGNSCINSVTYAEIISFYSKKGLSEELLKQLCNYVEILPINNNISFNAGSLIKVSQKYGLSLGDRFCLASAMYEKMPVYTADRIWLSLKDDLGVEVLLIR